MTTSGVINQRTGTVIATNVAWAHTALTCLKGLLGTRSLDVEAGIWLKPCKSIHTLGMVYPIDVVFLDQEHHICRLVHAVSPLRFCFAPRQTRSVLELSAGRIQQTDLQMDDCLIFG